MKAILFLLLLSGCSASGYDEAFQHYAVVISNEGISSGVRLGGGLVLTADHTVTKDSIAMVRTVDKEFQCVPIFVGELAVIYRDRLNLDTVIIADTRLGELVHWIQPRFEGGGAFLTFGYVSVIEDSSIFMDRPIMFGASGSGVWNSHGELIGVLQSFITIGNLPMYARASRVWVYREELR